MIASSFRDRYLLKLSGYGDADIINFYDEGGEFILALAAHRTPVGKQIGFNMKLYNRNHFIPFSSFHRYQRSDAGFIKTSSSASGSLDTVTSRTILPLSSKPESLHE